MKTNLLLASLGAAALCAVVPVQGDNLSSRGVARVDDQVSGSVSSLPDPGAIRRQFYGTVAEVNSASRLLVVRDDALGMQTLHADERTKISQGDKSARWSDIQVGMMVDGICVGSPGNSYAETINIGR